MSDVYISVLDLSLTCLKKYWRSYYCWNAISVENWHLISCVHVELNLHKFTYFTMYLMEWKILSKDIRMHVECTLSNIRLSLYDQFCSYGVKNYVIYIYKVVAFVCVCVWVCVCVCVYNSPTAHTTGPIMTKPGMMMVPHLGMVHAIFQGQGQR